jgi:hypothetical protein
VSVKVISVCGKFSSGAIRGLVPGLGSNGERGIEVGVKATSSERSLVLLLRRFVNY